MAALSLDGNTSPLAVQRREEAGARFAILMTVLCALAGGTLTALVPVPVWLIVFALAAAVAGVLALRWRASCR